MKELYEVYWTSSTEKLRDLGRDTALLDLNVPQRQEWSVADGKLLVHSELEPCLGQNQALAGGQDVSLLCHSLAGFLPHPPHSVCSTLSQLPLLALGSHWACFLVPCLSSWPPTQPPVAAGSFQALPYASLPACRLLCQGPPSLNCPLPQGWLPAPLRGGCFASWCPLSRGAMFLDILSPLPSYGPAKPIIVTRSLFCCFYLKPPAVLPLSVQPAPVNQLWSDSFPVHRTRARVILQRAGLTPPESGGALSRSLSWRDVAIGRTSQVFHFASPASWPARYPQRPLLMPVPSCPDFS